VPEWHGLPNERRHRPCYRFPGEVDDGGLRRSCLNRIATRHPELVVQLLHPGSRAVRGLLLDE